MLRGWVYVRACNSSWQVENAQRNTWGFYDGRLTHGLHTRVCATFNRVVDTKASV